MFALQSTPYTLPLLLDALLCGAMALLIWRRRQPDTGAIPFVVLFIGLVWWAVAYAAALAFVDGDVKRVFEVLIFVGVTTIPVGWFSFISVYSGHGTWLNRRNIALLLIEPVLVMLVAITNPLHHLFWASLTVVDQGGYLALIATHGFLFWVHTAYSYLVIVISVVILLRAMTRYPALYRGQAFTLLVGLFLPSVLNLFSIFTSAKVDFTPFAFTLACLAFGWSLLRYRLLNIVPIARASMIERMEDGVLVIDQQARIVDLNPAAARMIGSLTTAPPIGKTLSELLPDRAAFIARFRSLSQAQSEITDPRTGLIFDLRITPLYNRNNVLTGRIVTMHDITAIKQASAQISAQNASLQQANQELALARHQADDANALKSQFLATVSHELRTPLNAVVGYAQLLAQGVVGPLTPAQREYQERIVVNAKHLLDMINDVLDLSKIEAGGMIIVDRPYNVHEVLNEVLAQGTVLADQKQLPLTLTIDPALPPTLIGDAPHVQQILLNLISNAIKFTDLGQITVDARRASEQQWQLIVRDTGIGIAPDMQSAIFDEFRQVDHGLTRKYGGTGLGLSIVKRLVTLMSGEVQVQSVVDQGSTFTVTLPLRTAPDQPVPTLPQTAIKSEPEVMPEAT